MKVIILTRCFPPTNIIGAVRPFAMARFLADVGHDVCVVCVSGESIPETLEADTAGLQCFSVPVSKYIMALTPAKDEKTWIRVLKAVGRQMIFPDEFAFMRKRLADEIYTVCRGGFVPDVLISSALPFTMHVVANDVAKSLNCKWVADNRDLWAESPYRKRLKIMRWLDKRFESHVLSRADLVLVIGSRMANRQRSTVQSESKLLVIRNGADASDRSSAISEKRCAQGLERKLSFVYTGILYNGLRDPGSLFQALQILGCSASIHFYGSEAKPVRNYQRKYKNLDIYAREPVSKTRIKGIQRSADFLFLALGHSEFEKTVLTGKFFEYIEARRPIIAVCDEDSELANLINQYNLGIATRDSGAIARYIQSSVNSGLKSLEAVPLELSREHQLGILERKMVALLDE